MIYGPLLVHPKESPPDGITNMLPVEISIHRHLMVNKSYSGYNNEQPLLAGDYLTTDD